MKINEILLEYNRPEITSKIYVDLDGVLADFATPFNQKYNGDIKELVAKSDDEIYEMYRNLDMLADGEKLLGYLVYRKLPFTILTAPLRPRKGDNFGTIASERAKHDWVKEHLGPQYEKTMIVNHDKSPWAKKDGIPNILIDDMTRNTIPWNQKGGYAILHTNYDDTIAKLNAAIADITKKY